MIQFLKWAEDTEIIANNKQTFWKILNWQIIVYKLTKLFPVYSGYNAHWILVVGFLSKQDVSNQSSANICDRLGIYSAALFFAN